MIKEFKTAEKRQQEGYKACKNFSYGLREYRAELGPPDNTQVMSKNELNRVGLDFPVGDGSVVNVSYNIPEKNDDIVVSTDWTAPTVWSDTIAGIGLSDLSETAYEEVMRQAREQVHKELFEYIDQG